jgi:hypothetical protein
MTVGLAIVAAAMGLLAVAVSQPAPGPFVAGLCLSGLGLGTASVASTAYGTSGATESDAGIVGGVLNAAAQTGTAIGIAVLLVTAARSTRAAYLLAAALAVAALLGTVYHQRRTVKAGVTASSATGSLGTKSPGIGGP